MAVLVWPAAAVAQDPQTDALKVREYASQTGVTESEAARHLELQDRAPDIAEALELALGADFGGVWFDNVSGSFHVALTSPAAKHEAAEVLRQRNVLDRTTFETARRSAKELRDTALATTLKLEKHIAKRDATLAIDVKRNVVAVRVTKAVSRGVRDELGSPDARADAPAVQVEEVAPEAIPSTELAACQFNSCTRPLRGGVRIVRGGAGCTAGFVAFYPPTGERFLYTAGHCTAGGGDWSAYRYEGVGATLELIGPSAGSVFGAYGDAGSIKVTGPWNTVLQPIIAAWNSGGGLISEAHPMHDRARSYYGQYVCRMGATHAYSCGLVAGHGIPLAADGTVVGGQTLLGGACSLTGDSGGPVYSGYMALGTITASNTNTGVTCSQRPETYFQEAVDAEALLLNSRIITSVTGPR